MYGSFENPKNRFEMVGATIGVVCDRSGIQVLAQVKNCGWVGGTSKHMASREQNWSRMCLVGSFDMVTKRRTCFSCTDG